MGEEISSGTRAANPPNEADGVNNSYLMILSGLTRCGADCRTKA
jgi:hypothetical protein